MSLNPILYQLAVKSAIRTDEGPIQPPGYRLATGEIARCASCRHYEGQTSFCQKFNIGVDQNAVCDEYDQMSMDMKKAPVIETPSAPESIMTPTEIKQADVSLTGADSGIAGKSSSGGDCNDQQMKPMAGQPNDRPITPSKPPTTMVSMFGFSKSPQERLQKVAIPQLLTKLSDVINRADNPIKPLAGVGNPIMPIPTKPLQANPLVGAQPGDPNVVSNQPQSDLNVINSKIQPQINPAMKLASFLRRKSVFNFIKNKISV